MHVGTSGANSLKNMFKDCKYLQNIILGFDDAENILGPNYSENWMDNAGFLLLAVEKNPICSCTQKFSAWLGHQRSSTLIPDYFQLNVAGNNPSSLASPSPCEDNNTSVEQNNDEQKDNSENSGIETDANNINENANNGKEPCNLEDLNTPAEINNPEQNDLSDTV